MKKKHSGTRCFKLGACKSFHTLKYIYDKALLTFLEKTDWKRPDAEYLPYGSEIVNQYLIPASKLDVFKDAIIYNAEVKSISKTNLSKHSSKNRETTSFSVKYSKDGKTFNQTFDAVIDATGTWYSPNPIGLDGLPVEGEIANKEFIDYGIPDVLGKDKSKYLNKNVLVVGGGHSAINSVLNVLEINSKENKLYWGLRGNNFNKLLGGGVNDALPARGELGIKAIKAIKENRLSLFSSLEILKIEKSDDSLLVSLNYENNKSVEVKVDRIIVATGFRPDLSLTSELRLDLDSVVEAPSKLAPLIDPNLHSCGSVPPHGIEELSHYDKDFYIVGMKSYGRAPTFLMMTGYEQVRSIACELAGEYEAARTLELVLPKTGVCSTDAIVPLSDILEQETSSSCCATKVEKVVKPSCC